MGVLLFKGGVGVGMLKWQTSGFPSRSGGNLQEGACVDSARAIGRSLLNIAPPEDDQPHGCRREDIQRDIRQVQRLHRRV